ncbi:MAG: deoxynucleoside kinase [Brasilonema sp.]
MNRLISITGNVGTGKTSLTKILTQKTGWKPMFEPIDCNPYLIEFYQDMSRWSFHSNTSFLSHHAYRHLSLLATSISIVQDRSIYEHGEIFAFNAYRQGFMTKRDWDLYSTLYATLKQLLPKPNLIIYLYASIPTLINRINQRNLAFDRFTKSDYISQLNELYESWIQKIDVCPVLFINTEKIDFLNNEKQINFLFKQIVRFI